MIINKKKVYTTLKQGYSIYACHNNLKMIYTTKIINTQNEYMLYNDYCDMISISKINISKESQENIKKERANKIKNHPLYALNITPVIIDIILQYVESPFVFCIKTHRTNNGIHIYKFPKLIPNIPLIVPLCYHINNMCIKIINNYNIPINFIITYKRISLHGDTFYNIMYAYGKNKIIIPEYNLIFSEKEYHCIKKK